MQPNLQDCLDNFKGQSEFGYVDSKDENESEKASNQRQGDKWWIPAVKVPAGGLLDATQKWLQYQKDSVNQVLKAAMAINAQILAEMEIPESYIESLPKVRIDLIVCSNTCVKSDLISTILFSTER